LTALKAIGTESDLTAIRLRPDPRAHTPLPESLRKKGYRRPRERYVRAVHEALRKAVAAAGYAVVDHPYAITVDYKIGLTRRTSPDTIVDLTLNVRGGKARLSLQQQDSVTMRTQLDQAALDELCARMVAALHPKIQRKMKWVFDEFHKKTYRARFVNPPEHLDEQLREVPGLECRGHSISSRGNGVDRVISFKAECNIEPETFEQALTKLLHDQFDFAAYTKSTDEDGSLVFQFTQE